MAISISFAKKLKRLIDERKVPYSFFGKSSDLETFIEDKVVEIMFLSRSKRVVVLEDEIFLRNYLKNIHEINSLEEFCALNAESSRSDAAFAASDSKRSRVHVLDGFFIAAKESIPVCINGVVRNLSPDMETALFVFNPETLRIDEDVTVVGVENVEVFRNISQIKNYFTKGRFLFVLIYQSTRSFVSWLSGIPNNYLHFGDFDLAGIHIYLSKFRKHFQKKRCTFFVPDDMESLIKMFGSRNLYLKQKQYASHIKLENCQELIDLLDHINKYERCLEQEILLKVHV